ncbi:MAG: membrane dipeptidase [Chloroflexi bacterium]|nr:membrane dipeptidase [Chloroflexota bacterium]
MLIIDGDCGFMIGAMERDQDLTMSIEDVRNSPSSGKNWVPVVPNSEAVVSLPTFRLGGVAVILAKLWGGIYRPGSPIWGYRTGDIAYAMARGQAAYYQILDEKGEARVLTSGDQFSSHMGEWSEADDYSDLPVGMVIGIEGADPILWPEQVHEWWNLGVRVIGLSHYGVSTYSHGTGTGTDGGLFPPAKDLLREMDALGMILDVTHTSDESVRQAMDLFSGPVLASHQNCRALVPGERQFPDELLSRVIERGGVIGTSLDAFMLYKPGIDWVDIPGRRETYSRENVTLEDVADHMDYVCQLAGDSRHAAIGSDLGGAVGWTGAPHGVDSAADYQKLVGVLESRGHTEEDVSNIMHGNWQRFYEKWLP